MSRTQKCLGKIAFGKGIASVSPRILGIYCMLSGQVRFVICSWQFLSAVPSSSCFSPAPTGVLPTICSPSRTALAWVLCRLQFFRINLVQCRLSMDQFVQRIPTCWIFPECTSQVLNRENENVSLVVTEKQVPLFFVVLHYTETIFYTYRPSRLWSEVNPTEEQRGRAQRQHARAFISST